MIKASGLILLLFFACNLLMGAEVKMNDLAYAGNSFTFYIVPNFITEKQIVVGEMNGKSK